MQTIFDRKTLRYGVDTLFPSNIKNVFREDIFRDDLEMSGMKFILKMKKS